MFGQDSSQILYPEDIDRLCAVFEAVCDRYQILPDPEAALDLAADLVRLFQSGMTGETALRIAAEARLTEPYRLAG
ncbi:MULTISPECIES: hypothetical protein [Mesorhizobium]|uniref:Uncharacterized protein n=1 Tax=Rhizobium loti TaxID=381 RepID=A0A6M7U4G8_RHILI|nr:MULTISPECIES: hypothetical protein [Mesorhizobium]KRB22497.1 hypothetical protein ASE05_14910 [Mesorhizobium sp. Root172]OBQ62170.1 hypothetical protein A8145_21145 [Mesorhizobium loti]QKC71238.1 hypothetical protein EB815_20415 [Mesorhizobium loti]